MAYKKLIKFAEKNEEAKMLIKENMIFEAWIVYIRENEKDADDICNDIDEEISLKRCPLSDEEKESLQLEALDYLLMRRDEEEYAIGGGEF